MLVTPFYAAVLALLFFVLSIRTLRLRRDLQIAIGDSGDDRMLRAMRVHANFAEYVPITLLLIFMLESQGTSVMLIHGWCNCLIVGRLSHAYGVSQSPENFRFRVFGMALTFTAMVGAAISLLLSYGSGLLA